MEELYNSLFENGDYTGSFEEFKEQFGDSKKSESLYNALNEAGDYTESLENFNTQFDFQTGDAASADASSQEGVIALTDQEIEDTDLALVDTSLESPKNVVDPDANIESVYDNYQKYADENMPVSYNFDNPVGQFVVDKLAAFASGTTELLAGVGDFGEMLIDAPIQSGISLYNYFADDENDITQEGRNVVSGVIEQAFFMDDVLRVAADASSRLKTKRDDEDGVGILGAIKEGNYLEAVDRTLSGIFEAVPSVVAVVAGGPVGLGVIGASSTGQHYEEKSEKNPEERGLAMLGVSVVQGGVELASELVTKGIFKGVGKIAGMEGKAIAKSVLGRISAGMFFEGASEVGSEELNNVIDQTWGLNKYYDKDGNFDAQSTLTRVFDTFLISAALGGGTTVAGELSGRQKALEADRMMSPLQQKQNIEISKEISELQKLNTGVDNSQIKEKIALKKAELLKNNAVNREIVDGFSKDEKVEYLNILQNQTELQAEAKNLNLTEDQSKLNKQTQEQNISKLNSIYKTKADALAQERKAKTLQFAEDAASLGVKSTPLSPDDFNKKAREVEISLINENLDESKVAKKTEEINNTDYSKDSGGFYANGEFFMNKDRLVEINQLNVGAHETLHPILNALVGNAKQQGDIVEKFKKQLSKEQLDFMEGMMKARGYTQKGKDTYSKEYLTVFSDAIADKEIKYNETLFTKIGDMLMPVFRSLGFSKLKFDSGKDVYNFMREYSKSADKGAISKDIKQFVAPKLGITTDFSKTKDKITLKEGDVVTSDMVVRDKLSEDDTGFLGDIIDEASKKGKIAKIVKINGVSEKGTSVDIRVVTPDGATTQTVFINTEQKSSFSKTTQEQVDTLEEELDDLDVMDFADEFEYDQAISNLESKIRSAKVKAKKTEKEDRTIKEEKTAEKIPKKTYNNEKLIETIRSKETSRKDKAAAEADLVDSFDTMALKAIKYDTRKGDYDRTEIRDYLRGFFPSILKSYKPEEAKFSTWVYNNMAPKAQQTYEKFRKIADKSLDAEAGTTGSVKEAVDETTTYTESTSKTKPKGGTIKPVNLLKDPVVIKEYKEAVAKAFKDLGLSLDDLTFGKLTDLAPEVIAKYLKLPLNKITQPADNLSFTDFTVTEKLMTGTDKKSVTFRENYPDAKEGDVIKNEARKIQDFIKTNLNELLRLMPDENVAPELASVDADAYKTVKGTGLKIKPSLLKYFYEKTGKRSKGLTSQTDISKLKKLTKEDFLEGFGITKDASGQFKYVSSYDRVIGQRLKAIVDLFGKLATNTEVRQLEGITETQAQNIAAGKSGVQFSKTLKNTKLNKDQKKSLITSINDLKSKNTNEYLTNDVWNDVILAISNSSNIYDTFKSTSEIVGVVLTTKGKREFEIKLLSSLVNSVNLDIQSAIIESFKEYRKIFKYEYRTIGFDYVKSNLKAKIEKSDSLEEKTKAVLDFIKYESRSIRTGNIDGIRTNESLFNELLKPLGVEDLGFKLLKKDGKTFITLNDVVLTGMLDITKIKQGFTPETVSLMNSEASSALDYVISVLNGLSLDKAKGYLNLISLDQRGILRKLSKPGFEITGFKTNDLILEHETTAFSIYKKLIDFNRGYISEAKLRDFIEKSKVNLIPKTLDKILNNKDLTVFDSARYNVKEFVDVLNKYKEEGKYKNIEYSSIFSKNNLSKTLNSSKYKKFIKDIKDKTLYHGGSNTLEFDATWFYINDFEAAEMWGDNKVYGVKVSDLDNNIIIPDLNDVGEFAKYASEKFNLPKETFFDIRNILTLKNADEIINEWFDWVFTNDTTWDLGYNLYENGKINDAAVTVLGKLPKSKVKLSFSKTSSNLNSSIEKASKSNNDMLPKSQRLTGDFTMDQVLDKMRDLDNQQTESEIQFSNTLNLDKDFNDIIENKTGIASGKEFKRVKAEVVGASKGRFKFLIPPSAEDFVGLLYATLGKGTKGDTQMAWYKKVLLNPFARAMENISRDRNALGRDFKALKKTLKIVPKNLKKKVPGEPFTIEQAVRVWIWNQIGKDVPGLDDADVKLLVDYVNARPDLKVFGTEIMKLNKGTAYISPSDSWNTGTITTDLLETLNTTKRKQYLEVWQQNVDIIFSEKNLNKLEAAYGKQYRKSMENILTRMKTGRNRITGADSLTNRVTDWLTGSIGAIMFFNTRSAVLQTLSAINFINFGDNNVLAAGKAFANQKQYWTDFKKLFNSEFLIERRDGLKMNVNEADIADIAKEKGVRGVINKLLKLGFTPTQLADSFAIASGGSTFYRNRLNALIKGGMNTQAAEKQAMSDFREIAEESQQSSRPDKISQQQAGPLGRIVLAFANTPAQYARLMKKAASDIKNRRGDDKTNVSKIIYYGVAQNLMFNALQQALFAISFGEDEEEDETKIIDTANGMIDSLLRGIGVGGAIVSTTKNAVLRIIKESQKKNPKYDAASLELLKISPPISSKITKIRAAGRSFSWDKKEMKEKGFSLDNPAYLAMANIISATTNVPLDRVIKKINNVMSANRDDLDYTQKIALLAGWSEWQLGIDEAKEEVESTKKRGGKKVYTKKVYTKKVYTKRDK